MDKMLTAEEYFEFIEASCANHSDYMEFADHYACYVYAYDSISARKAKETNA